MATLVTGGLRKVIADFHQENPKQSGLNRHKLFVKVEEEIGAGLYGLEEAIRLAEVESYYNPVLDRDELVYQAVRKVERDHTSGDWVLPDPDARRTSLPYANSNFRI